MARKQADVTITLSVAFEDDGQMDLNVQAIDAAMLLVSAKDEDLLAVEVVGPVIDAALKSGAPDA